MTIFKSYFQEFIHKSRYARWDYEKGRREHWEETVSRYVDFMFSEQVDGALDNHRQEVHDAICGLEVMPSMRAMMTAGPALTQDNAAGFNCSYLAIDDVRAFDEMLYVLMCGTGVGFSVERQFIKKLPTIPDRFDEVDYVIMVEDSRIGWASALREFIHNLCLGKVVKYDTSKIRKAGSILYTFGGRSSGPKPLEACFKFFASVFKKAAGRKLTSVECHDLCCKVGEITVSGGVRQSACISLSNLSDDRMRHAKSGEWYKTDPHRAYANNSVAYTEKPAAETFMREWLALMESKSGERGLFNRVAALKRFDKCGREHDDISTSNVGINPCAEIILRSCQFCNLSEVVVRPEDDVDSLKRKVRLATIVGTIQSSLTDFRYLRDVWKENTEEEALLGVSLTGIMDNKLTNGSSGFPYLGTVLEELKDEAVKTNEHVAAILGINPSKALCCVKPSGTVSQLVNSSSGIHPRYSAHYVRNIRCIKTDPIGLFLSECGVPFVDEPNNEHRWIFSFPVKAPEQSIQRKHVTALDQLELMKVYIDHWCHHSVSITINVRDDEWFDVGAWVYGNFDSACGVSFLPDSGHSYQWTPYEECSKEDYEALVKLMPESIDWDELATFESEDYTLASSTVACVSGSCSTADIL